MSRYVSYRDFDWLLIVFVLMLCGLGVMEIRSATVHTKFAGAHIKQLYWIGGGLIDSNRDHGSLFSWSSRQAGARRLALGRAYHAPRVAQAEALPEGPPDQLHGTGGRQAGLRLPGHPVEDRRGVWRNLGRHGDADPSFLSPGAADGFHFRCFCRGTRIRRSFGGAPAILHCADAFDPERSNGARPRWDVRGDGRGSCA